MAGFKSEWWPDLFRNGGRHQIGTMAGFASEYPIGFNRNLQPMLAQGANIAIEDGMVLSRCLFECDSIVSALQQYDEICRTRANKLVRGAIDNVKRFHNPILADAVGAQHYVDTE